METEKKIDLLRKKLWVAMACLGVFIGFAIVWSSQSAIRTGYALMTLDTQPLIDDLQTGHAAPFVLRRRIQMHFLKHDLYVPLEDIVLHSNTHIDEDRIIFLMRNACGEGKLFVWVPFIFRFPIIGTSVWEYCWTPALAKPI